jgi:hypothetical protein
MNKAERIPQFLDRIEKLKGSDGGLAALTLDDANSLFDIAKRFFELDCQAASQVESVICMRTGFTGEPPYVGWRGLGLALTEAFDARDQLADAIRASFHRVLGRLARDPHEAIFELEAWARHGRKLSRKAIEEVARLGQELERE